MKSWTEYLPMSDMKITSTTTGTHIFLVDSFYFVFAVAFYLSLLLLFVKKKKISSFVNINVQCWPQRNCYGFFSSPLYTLCLFAIKFVLSQQNTHSKKKKKIWRNISRETAIIYLACSQTVNIFTSLFSLSGVFYFD